MLTLKSSLSTTSASWINVTKLALYASRLKLSSVIEGDNPQ